MTNKQFLLDHHVKEIVSAAVAEDLGSGDITAQLIPPTHCSLAEVISREDCVVCGRAWVDETFRQIDPRIVLHWNVKDGAVAKANTTLFTVEGNTRNLLSAERTALNFLQLLSGTATTCRSYADLVKTTKVKLLDTRKTIPGLRRAQKYAVTCGGCHNHRLGLFDAFLIKENHIRGCGGILPAIAEARKQAPQKTLEIEVENISELQQAIEGKADIVMLDNFNLEQLRQAVALSAGQTTLEASGGITRQTLLEVAQTGLDYISIGALTKNCKAIDLSMSIIQ